MQSDFSLFRERLAHACRVRDIKLDRLCASIGLGSRRRVDLASSGLKALHIYGLAQIADRLEVSVDLAARSLRGDGIAGRRGCRAGLSRLPGAQYGDSGMPRQNHLL